ncbi:MAG: class I SAM-dependent methyltransferase [Ferruginibacter sp.]
MYSAPQLAKKYIRYYLSASNGKGHGVHSPFVFDFIKFVKNDRRKYECYEPIEKLRLSLLKDQRSIAVQDFGAGSTVIKTNQRVVAKMAASSLKPRKFAQLLFRIVQQYKPSTILELGTSFGITSAYLASGHAAGKLYTLEGSPSIAAIARQNFQSLGIHNIELLEGDFANTFSSLLESLPAIDLAFVDGNHRKAPTLDYFQQLLHKSHNDTILIFDDIHWSREMEEAWEIIKKSETVTLSLDLFFIGIVFFKKEFKIKQDYSIRF